MSHYRFILPALVAASAALGWGCTRPPAVADDGKARGLEARVAKLEQDVKAGAAARDGLQQKLTAADGKARQLEARAEAAERDLAAAAVDRDAARQMVAARTAERDAVQTQFEAFRKNLREMLGQADLAAAPAVPPPAVTVVNTPTTPRGGL